MDINVTNLNLGYEQCERLNTLVRNSGETLLGELAGNISSLKAHWIGSDATNHINNLIVVYEALAALLTDAKAITADVGNKMIAIQTVRNANGGGGSIGTELPSNAPDTQTIERGGETAEYNVDPSAKADYQLLVEECSEFSRFVSEFKSMKDELLSNWTAGVNREQAVSNFNNFESNSDTYNKYMTDARDNLEIAISNIEKLQ